VINHLFLQICYLLRTSRFKDGSERLLLDLIVSQFNLTRIIKISCPCDLFLHNLPLFQVVFLPEFFVFLFLIESLCIQRLTISMALVPEYWEKKLLCQCRRWSLGC